MVELTKKFENEKGECLIRSTNLLYLWIVVASVGLVSSCCSCFNMVGTLSS